MIDYVGGRDDLRHGLVRAIGDPDARFEEDHLRLLRAVRFAARLGFEIEAATADAIRRHAGAARRGSARSGSARKCAVMLTPPTRGRAWELWDGLGLEGVIFGSWTCRGVAADPVRTGGGCSSTGWRRAGRCRSGWRWRRRRWSTSGGGCRRGRTCGRLLRRPVRAADREALRQSLKISNDESDQMQGTLEGLGPLLARRAADGGGAEAVPGPADRPAVARTARRRWQARWIAAGAAWLRERLAELEQTEYAPPPLITGDDLTAAGLSPGPVFKKVLERAYDEQLEGRVTTKEQALRLGAGTRRG